MTCYNYYLSALLIVATCCTMFISHISWKRRQLPISLFCSLAMLLASVYSFGYAFEIISDTLKQIRFWLRIEYIGIAFGTPIWFIMVLLYTKRNPLKRYWLYALLMVIPTLTLIAHYTNELHHLFYRDMSIVVVKRFTLVSLTKGPLYYVHIAHSYALLIVGMGMLAHMYRAQPNMRKQIMFMMIGSAAPYLFTLVYLLNIIDIPIDLGPFGLIVSGVCFVWGIYQFNMLKLAPLAWQMVFESMRDIVIVFDLSYNMISINQAGKQIMEAHNSKKTIGQPASVILSNYPELLEKLHQEPGTESDIKVNCKSESRYYNVRVTQVFDSRQTPIGKMLLLSEVTEQVLAQERLLENAKQLSELNSFKDKLFNVVAHDIRDPLAVLTSLMDLLEEELRTCGGTHDEVVREMGQQVRNTFTLVEGLLDWFRSQQGGLVFKPVVWDLSLIVPATVQLLQVRCDAKRIRLSFHIPRGTLVYADKEMLDLIFRNLLSNAIKFTSYGGSISLKATQSANKVIVSIQDSGEGITPEQAKSLLQEEHPIPLTGTDGEKGVGLGLVLCREFVHMNGGDIWFDSSPAKGSTFYFSIPTSHG